MLRWGAQRGADNTPGSGTRAQQDGSLLNTFWMLDPCWVCGRQTFSLRLYLTFPPLQQLRPQSKSFKIGCGPHCCLPFYDSCFQCQVFPGQGQKCSLLCVFSKSFVIVASMQRRETEFCGTLHAGAQAWWPPHQPQRRSFTCCGQAQRWTPRSCWKEGGGRSAVQGAEPAEVPNARSWWGQEQQQGWKQGPWMMLAAGFARGRAQTL